MRLLLLFLWRRKSAQDGLQLQIYFVKFVARVASFYNSATSVEPARKKEKNFAEFQQSRKELQEAIEELEGYGESIPEELKFDLLETPIDRFQSIEEWEMFTESFNQKINDF